jgi:hypothetical protein
MRISAAQQLAEALEKNGMSTLTALQLDRPLFY